MANEFVARKGLISSGSIRVSGSVTASYFVGDGSQLTNIATSTVLSSSLNIDTYTFVGNGVTTNYVLSQSYDPSSLLVSVDGLSQTYVTDYTLATSTISFISAPPSQSNILIKAFVNVAQGATGSFSGSFFGIFSSASYALTASYAANAGGGLSGGTQNYIPLWSSTTSLTSSILYQTASGVLVNSQSHHTPEAPDALGVFAPPGSTSYNLISGHANINNYAQVNIKNFNAGNSASTDIVATADFGTETAGYIDLGINSSGYTYLGSGIGTGSDGYLYLQSAGDLLIGNKSANKRVVIFSGEGNAIDNARILADPSGSVGINTGVFDPTNPEALLIQSLNNNTFNLVKAYASVDNYIQFNIQNNGTGLSSSADVVATANNGSETSNYIDFGINSSNYAVTNFVGGPNDAYLYSTGQMLHIGNATPGQDIMFFVGSTDVEASKKLILRDTNQHELTGSLNVLGNISGNLVLPANTVSSSTQVKTFLPIGTVTSSAQYPGWVTASSQIDYNSIQNKLSGVVSSSAQVAPLLPNGTVSSSAQYPGWVTSSGQVSITATSGYSTFSSSIATKNDLQDISINALNAATSSYAVNATIQGQLAGVVSSSTQVKPLLPGGTVSSSAQYPGWVTASSQIDYNSIQNKLSDVVSSSTQFTSLTAPFSGSFTGSHIGTVTASALQILNTTDTTATNKVLVLDTATNQVFTTASVGGGGGTGTVGPGTVNSIALFNASSTISSSNIFQSTNNIGIGTTAPVARLSVVDAGNVQSSIAGTDVTAYSQLLLSGSGRAFGVGVGNASETTYGVANEFFLFDHNAAAMRLTVNTIGNVGVGTTAPGVKLEVNGEISASAFISGSLLNIREMSMLVSGTIAAPGGTTVTLNLNNANYFVVSASGTGTITWVVTNPPPTGRSQTIIIEYINGGVVTNSWFTGTRWSGGVAPTLTSGANPDVLGFITDDAGTNWRGVLLQRNSS